MSKTLSILVCGLLVLALAVPALAGPPQKKAGPSLTSRVYSGTEAVADKSAGLCTGLLHRTFSFFNPCLDLVKGCTTTVLYPLNYSFDYMEQTVENRLWSGKKQKAYVPKQR